MQSKENTNIVQSNYLLENRPKFTKDETRLFLTIIGELNKDDSDFKVMKIPVSDFGDLWGIDLKNAYTTIKNALRGLRNKEFYLEGVSPETGRRRFITSSSISTATYEEGAGFATVEISAVFKPYLLALKKNYTKYVLENILNLSTVNAIRNYELLKQYEVAGKRVFSVDEYKKILKLEDRYKRNTDLRVKVIEPAVDEINANTDIRVSFEIVGRGKRAKIVFDIVPAQKCEALPAAEDEQLPGQISLDDFSDDVPEPQNVLQSPLKMTFGDETEKLEYIDRYVDATFEHDFNKDLLDSIPTDVHEYEESKVMAIRSFAVEYLPEYITTQSDKQLWIMKVLHKFKVREWDPKHARNVRFEAYGYYVDNFKRWLGATFGERSDG